MNIIRIFIFTILLLFSGQALASVQGFNKWLIDFKSEAVQYGISKEVIEDSLSKAQFVPIAIKLDRKQPEAVKTFRQYKKVVLSEQRINEGRANYLQNQNLLKEIEEKYGVDASFIVALWGVETHYGKITGNFRVVDALATLAYEGRRHEFFKKELVNALKILEKNGISTDSLLGSWAGAMGQCQFMPSSYLSYAKDYDNDGLADIWNNDADIFASIANYLASSGWNKGEKWGDKVKLPKDFDIKEASSKLEKPINEWKRLGVVLANGKPLPESDKAVSIVSLEPEGALKEGGNYFMVYDNYKTLLKWNRSLYFATTVSMLAEKIK